MPGKARVDHPTRPRCRGTMMSKAYDRELGMGRDITRRDFLNGVAVTVGGSMLSSQKLDKSVDFNLFNNDIIVGPP